MTTTSIALALAGAFAALSPLWLRYVRRSGLSMATISYIVALLVAVLASVLSGEIRRIDLSSVGSVLATSSWLWLVQQAVYNLFKEKLPQAIQTP